MSKKIKCDFHAGNAAKINVEEMTHSKFYKIYKILRIINIPQTKFEFQKIVYLLIFNCCQNHINSSINASKSDWTLLLWVINPNKKVYTTSSRVTENLGITKVIYNKFYRFCYAVFLHKDNSIKNNLPKSIKSQKMLQLFNSIKYGNKKVIHKKLSLTGKYRIHFQNINAISHFKLGIIRFKLKKSFNYTVFNFITKEVYHII